MTRALLLAHVAATLMMVGVIWMVQVVHYPLFARVGTEAFPAYQAEHSRLITLLIALPWAVEGVCALALLAIAEVSRPVAVVNLVLLGVTVVATVLTAVPQHEILGRGFDESAHRALLTANWVRTVAWTGCGALSLAMLAGALTPD